MDGINITYKEIAPLLKTGDIVLFHGDSNFQEVIDLLTGSRFNHVAMVVLSKDIGLTNTEAPILLWESTPYLTTIDQKLHKPKAGPTLVDLETRIKDELASGTFTTFVFRRLANELNSDNFSQLRNAIREVYPDKFPSTFLFFLKGILGRIFNRQEQKSTYFCSELIAYTYQKMGLISETHPPDFYEPKDFSTLGHLKLLNDQSLGENLNLELIINET